MSRISVSVQRINERRKRISTGLANEKGGNRIDTLKACIAGRTGQAMREYVEPFTNN